MILFVEPHCVHTVALGEGRFQVGAATPHVHSGLWELFSGRSTPETVPPPAAPAASLILQISRKIGKANQPRSQGESVTKIT